jgi:hypothetical protein
MRQIIRDTQKFGAALWRDRRGQDMLEYVLLGGFAAACAVSCFPAVLACAKNVNVVMQGLLDAIQRLTG